LRINFRPAYDSLRWKIFLVIFSTTVIFIIRQVFYVKESLYPSVVPGIDIYRSIPFYITECVIALALNYMLFQITRNND
jgi:hypothetical protein